jgi:hypothetical protein
MIVEIDRKLFDHDRQPGSRKIVEAGSMCE